MSASPKISVLLPVYNVECFLGDALASLAAQTFKDFEVIAVDDGSTDWSSNLLMEAARKWPWLHVIRQANKGMANGLNHGLSQCRGEFVARMDADDIAHPKRLEKQISAFSANPQIGMLGASIRTIGAGARQKWQYPTGYGEIRARIFFSSPFAHPVVMFRREAIAFRQPLYRENIIVAQDYELWSDLVWRTECMNLPDVLLDYRRHGEQLSSSKNATMERETNLVWTILLQKLGLDAIADELTAHGILAGRKQAASADELRAAAVWADRLEQANTARLLIPEDQWTRELQRGWYLACRNAAPQCGNILNIYRKSRFHYNPNSRIATGRLLRLILFRLLRTHQRQLLA